MAGIDVAIVGATGAVGDLMRQVLLERKFPVRSIRFLASAKSAGKTVEFAGKRYPVEPLRPEAFEGVQIVLSSTPSAVSREYSPLAARAGAIVIDNSSAWRMDPDCPLVVPEVNAAQLQHIRKGIVANPNCVAIPLCVALKPLHDRWRVKRVVVATYQSSSGKGAKGLADFEAQLQAWVRGEPIPPPTAHRGQLAGNVLTLDWTLDTNGFTEEENKVIQETKKILGDAEIGVCATCVRVPVRVAHSEAVTVEFHQQPSVDEARAALRQAPGIRLLDERQGEVPQPIHAAGTDWTYVGRVRSDPSHPHSLCLWLVADNLRKGAATNAVQCAEELLRRGIVSPRP
ncbi:MAG: aspartate-semialdehyde dehydrogenase [Gemmataceae bacterium]|nr:aspartate-semialdehyde dehydrogenase [Gemmataceae bacterium]MCS7269739.1 aspartate-semialdehyde dehydrogenase [Gemmataceae bacterium]MDW8243658.1 aspartate-semialdehyde dehydrogenase [Thermogemmata sp.]